MNDQAQPQLPRTGIPKECHLWKNRSITADEIRASLDPIQEYEDDSHLMRRLYKCRDCGHLYFYEFYEDVDWERGRDAQYRSWIPVDDAKSADILNGLSPLELLKYPSLRIDFPSKADKPSEPHWNKKRDD